MNPRPGEVWLADLGWSAKYRPVVIVSRHDPDPPRSLIIYVPITTQYRDSAYEVALPRHRFLDHDSFVNAQGIGSVPITRLGRKLGVLSNETMAEIKDAIVYSMDLTAPSI